jgi:hypothetical protein
LFEIAPEHLPVISTLSPATVEPIPDVLHPGLASGAGATVRRYARPRVSRAKAPRFRRIDIDMRVPHPTTARRSAVLKKFDLIND